MNVIEAYNNKNYVNIIMKDIQDEIRAACLPYIGQANNEITRYEMERKIKHLTLSYPNLFEITDIKIKINNE